MSIIKNSLIKASIWGAILASGISIGPIVGRIANGISIDGAFLAEKLILGVGWFLLTFIGIFIWGLISQRNSHKNSTEGNETAWQNSDQQPTKLPSLDSETISKWNYVFSGVGAFMLLFVFLPGLIKGTLVERYYIGAAFWVGVIIYCSLNIYRAKKKS